MTDTPHYFVAGPCWSCGNLFTFNPHRVPSIPVDPATGQVTAGGVRQPICRTCAELANENRKRSGLPLWDTSEEAYGPVEGLPE